MELKQYWSILSRRLWIVASVTLATAVTSLLFDPIPPASYSVTMRVLVDVLTPSLAEGPLKADLYSKLNSTERLSEDLAQVVKSQAFRQEVMDNLQDSSLDGVSIGSSPGANRLGGRIVEIMVVGRSPLHTERVSQAVAEVIQSSGNSYFAEVRRGEATTRLIDPPIKARADSRLRSYLNTALRISLGLVSGMALLFLIHYLDSTIYEAWEVEQLLHLPVLGELPRHS
ncbi:MAG: putative polysaccharide biosynthesis protein [Dehalococcoidia bacterium]|nr:putative polysaccharide biosynthesis protein [Dehalococcoidia bacterium]